MKGTSVGIDFGSSAIATAVLQQKKDGKIAVIGMGSSPSAGMRRGAVVLVEEASAALRKSIREAGKQSGIEIQRAFVGVGGTHIGAQLSRGAIAVSRADGEVTADDVERVIQAAGAGANKNPNREIIHVIPRQFKVDGEVSIGEPVGMVGMKLEAEVLVVDGAKSALQNLIKCCELAGLEIENWMSSTLAASEVILSKKQKEFGVMLLDLGADTSDYAVFEEGHLVDVGSFPIGGNHITSDIAVGFRAPIHAAEEIKIRYANATFTEKPGGKRETIALADFVHGDDSVYHMRDLGEIVSARLTDIFELASKALKKSGRAGLLPGGVVITGGGADIPGVHELARKEIKLPIEITRAIAIDKLDDVIPPRFAIPVGLVMWHASSGVSRIRPSSAPWEFLRNKTRQFLRAFIP